MRKTSLLAIVFLMSFGTLNASAQFGSLSGIVRDQDGLPVPFVNVLIVGTSAGAMTNDKGIYTVPAVPAGQRVAKVLGMGYMPRIATDVRVRPGEESHFDFIVELLPKDSQNPPGPIPQRFPLPDPKSQAIMNKISMQTGIRQLGANGPFPVLFEGLMLSIRYEAEQDGQSTKVTIIADATNVDSLTLDVCGTFVVIKDPFDIDADPLGVGRRSSSKAMACDQRTLGPGESFSKAFAFSVLKPEVYERVWVWFFRGRDGDPWEETVPVDLGRLEILVRPFN